VHRHDAEDIAPLAVGDLLAAAVPTELLSENVFRRGDGENAIRP
jgi:hypothetical protein